jgi:superfamily I DNA/RNA helicase
VTYLAITGATASWLLGKPGLLDTVHDGLVVQRANIVASMAEQEFVEGPVRIAASPNGMVIAFWNVDYVSGAGDDTWGFIDIEGEHGLSGSPSISREVLERCLYVISQRSQGLLIDGSLIHRGWDDDIHTCLAGRGEARQVNIGYVEMNVEVGQGQIRASLLEGPQYDFNQLCDLLRRKRGATPVLLNLARSLYDPSRRKSVLDSSNFPDIRAGLLGYLSSPVAADEYGNVSVATTEHAIPQRDNYRTVGWDFFEWLQPHSPLSSVQRRILESDAIIRHPIRIVGPGGSGKTLLMQLLAVKRLQLALSEKIPISILYLVHNSKMAETVKHRFSMLLSGEANHLISNERSLSIKTLSEFGVGELGLDATQIVDSDAQEAKEFQLETLSQAMTDVLSVEGKSAGESTLFSEVRRNPILLPVFTRLLMSEISTAIKGHGLSNDERRYTESERALSRLHGILSINERRLVFRIFRRYHEAMFDGFGVLDSDDIAISLLGKLRTPIWELKRKQLGFDHLFVDEAQLFNENERRLLPLLTKSATPNVPVVLALDEAQDLYAHSKAGLGTLGIEGMASENLQAIHRSSRAIIRLAFFVIQRSTDLFGPDFPDFTGLANEMTADDANAQMPRIETVPDAQREYGRFILRRIRALRKANSRRIAVICMAERYWRPILDELKKSDLPLHVLENRGERLGSSEPIVVLSRPTHVGGQEFDAVIIAGAEQGLVPPRVLDNDALASAVEQQALRELYLSITRSRDNLVVCLAKGASLSPILADALAAGLLIESNSDGTNP